MVLDTVPHARGWIRITAPCFPQILRLFFSLSLPRCTKCPQCRPALCGKGGATAPNTVPAQGEPRAEGNVGLGFRGPAAVGAGRSGAGRSGAGGP